MAKVAQIPWGGVSQAIDLFCAHFQSEPTECSAYGRLALSLDHLQLAAIASRGTARLGRREEAAELAVAICERSFVLADALLRENESVARLDCYKAAYAAAEGDPALLKQCASRIQDVLQEEIGQADETAVDLGSMLEFEHLDPEILSQGFEVLVGRGDHVAAAKVAESVRLLQPDRLNKPLFSMLRELCNGLLDDGKNIDGARAYFDVLSRMPVASERLAPLARKLVKAMSTDLLAALDKADDWPTIGSMAEFVVRIDPSNALALRARGFFFAQENQASECDACLDTLNGVASRDWKFVLDEARRSRQAGRDSMAGILYGWLKKSGYVEHEATKAVLLISRQHVQQLRAMQDSPNEDVLAAALALLELDPHETTALLMGARALVRMREVEKARAMLTTLLAIVPGQAAAERLLARCDSLTLPRSSAPTAADDRQEALSWLS